MPNKKTPQQVVKECETILKANNMAGVVVALDENEGYYELTLKGNSLFQWSGDETSVRLSLAEASLKHVDDEFHTLKTLSEMLDCSDRAVLALLELLTEAIEEKRNPKPAEERATNMSLTHKRRYDN